MTDEERQRQEELWTRFDKLIAWGAMLFIAWAIADCAGWL